ncbi:hypothetical protein BDV06DRAFT_232839 [Aspergillus oleicola]
MSSFCVVSLTLFYTWQEFMDHPTGAWLGFINALYWIGTFVGALLAAWVSNRFGRRGGIWLAPLLLNIIAYPTHRPFANALFMCGFGTRMMDSSWSWRIPSLMQLVCPFLALPALLILHASSDADSPVAENAHATTAGYAGMLLTSGNRYRLFITVSVGLFAQWVGNGVVSYYLTLALDGIGMTDLTLIFTIAGAVSVERVGRRVLFLLSGAMILVSYMITTGLSGGFATKGSSPIGKAVVPFLLIYFAGYDISLTPLLTAYSCEIWPYRLRSRGLSVAWISVVVGNMFNTFVNPIALDAIGWEYYFVFVAVLIAYEIWIYFFYLETRGHTLEQMAVLFEKDAAVAASQGILAGEDNNGSEEKVERV